MVALVAQDNSRNQGSELFSSLNVPQSILVTYVTYRGVKRTRKHSGRLPALWHPQALRKQTKTGAENLSHMQNADEQREGATISPTSTTFLWRASPCSETMLQKVH